MLNTRQICTFIKLHIKFALLSSFDRYACHIKIEGLWLFEQQRGLLHIYACPKIFIDLTSYSC